MYLTGVLMLAISAIALVSTHPLESSQQDAAAVDPTTLVRDKRTIGILRDLFPNFSQGGGGGGGGGGSDDDSRISITLPTYPPDQLDDDDEEEDEDTSAPTSSDTDATDATTNADSENTLSKREARPKRSPDTEAEEEEDLEPDATGDNEVASDNEAESDGEAVDEEDPRNKRFLNFNLGGSASAGAGGGSGNFLFDIIRRSADRAARMAGTVYRVLAGTDDAGLPTYNHQRSLVAGSGNSPTGDGSHAAVEEGKEEAVPGPLTRLFVVANKGVAALIQDLILRLAQTSERIVNFKAKLITSII